MLGKDYLLFFHGKEENKLNTSSHDGTHGKFESYSLLPAL
jgi:hypothetical protein